MSLLYIIEDEPILAECVATSVYELAQGALRINVYNDAISAIEAINEELPDVILLDVLLGGHDAFTLLNELISYPDTARIPVVIMTSLKLQLDSLEHYGVVEILDKMKMTPDDIYAAVNKALEIGQRAEFQAQKPQQPEQPQAQPHPQPQPETPQISGLAALNQKLSSASSEPESSVAPATGDVKESPHA